MANPNDERKGQGGAPDQGFNTIRNSSIEKREKKNTLRSYTFLAIVALTALLIVTLLVTAIGGIIANVAGNGTPGNDETKDPSDKSEDIKWTEITLSDADTQKGALILADAAHAYVAPGNDEHLELIYAAWDKHSPRAYQLSGLSTHMERTALYAMDKLLADFNAASTKNNVLFHYAYLDAEKLASADLPQDHLTGLGCVLKYEKEQSNYDLSADPAYAWITENCHKYGFVVRYPADKAEKTGVADYDAYFRYVGVAHASYMAEQELCLEEYIEALKEYTSKKPLTVTAADGKQYDIYYAAVKGNTKVACPENYGYTVSGTNEGGVIITVCRTDGTVSAESEADTTESGSESDSESDSESGSES